MVDLTDYYEPSPFRTKEKKNPYREKWKQKKEEKVQLLKDPEIKDLIEEDPEEKRNELFLDEDDDFVK